MTRADKPDLKGCRVLLVEDEFFIADDMTQALRSCGALVVGPASTIAKGLALAAEESLTCAVLDINLRGENGFRIAEELRRRGVPFVYASGYEPSIVPGTLEGVAHLEKPFRIEELLAAVSDLCRRHESAPGTPARTTTPADDNPENNPHTR